MTIVFATRCNLETGTKASIEQNKYERCYILRITKYGHSIKTGIYNSFDNAKRAGNRYFKQYEDNSGSWTKTSYGMNL